MILTVDVGNTNITIGAYKGDSLIFTARLATDKHLMADQYACSIIDILSMNGVARGDFSGAIISCVVPEVIDALDGGIEKVIGKKPLIIGPGVKTGLNIKIDVPSSLGADLVTTAVGAVAKYPMPCLIVDLGTASKITVLDENGDFCGGAIAAGIKVSVNALSASASLLPSIGLQAPKRAIGKNTVDCLQSGIIFGAAGMVDGLVDRIRAELKSEVKTVVATGGLSQCIIPNCRTEMIYDENLILDGLKIIYDKNVK